MRVYRVQALIFLHTDAFFFAYFIELQIDRFILNFWYLLLNMTRSIVANILMGIGIWKEFFGRDFFFIQEFAFFHSIFTSIRQWISQIGSKIFHALSKIITNGRNNHFLKKIFRGVLFFFKLSENFMFCSKVGTYFSLRF